jgi:predicted nucleic acid-binding protein
LSATATSADRLAYADSSALVKLVVDEPESEALDRFLKDGRVRLISSRIALVEVVRTAKVANAELREAADALVRTCLLVGVGIAILDKAAELASVRLRTLGAIHLATALDVGADEMIVYDGRLAEAAATAGLHTTSPGR